jgi:glycosyltransferase involved in cell wall biosynthesis
MERIMEKIKVSVIIPVYNVENYIKECVESVINQTLKEIEIIIVNDGTKDNSIKKIEKYLSDSRVILINKENGGVSSARNAGLKIARGEYISFIDSDDFIELTMLEDLYNESKGMDIVLSNFARIDNLGNIKIEKNNFKNLEIKEGSYFYNIELGYVVNRIYNHEFLKKVNVKFREKMLLEDLLFSLKIFSKAKKVKYLDKVHYYYRIDINSSAVNTLTRNKELMNKTFDQLISEVEKFLLEFKGKKFMKLRIFLTV